MGQPNFEKRNTETKSKKSNICGRRKWKSMAGQNYIKKKRRNGQKMENGIAGINRKCPIFEDTQIYFLIIKY